MMKRNFILCMLVFLILINGWSIFLFELPFYQEDIIIASISVLIMTVVHERFVFLYAISLVLTYGAFLTIYAFINNQPSEIQLLYIYDHLLFTSFILLFWILLNLIKNIGYENQDLKQQVNLLQKYKTQTNSLTVSEFYEQAKSVIKSVERQQEEAWLVELVITYENKKTKKNLQEKLERVTLDTIRQNFDLVTSVDTIIFILLKDTNEDGVQRFLQRYQENLQEELNFVEPPFTATKEQIIDLKQLIRVKEGTT